MNFFCKRKNTTFYNCCYFTWPSSSLFIAYLKHSSHLSRQHFVILISSVTVKSNCQPTCVKACQLYSKMISQESWHLSEHLFYTHSCLLIIYPRIRHIYSAPIYARVTRSARLGLASLASDLDTVWHHFLPKSWYFILSHR